jgi:hypothetical protein
MKIYRVTVTADKWGNDYTIEASGWSTAASRAIREWKKAKGKGSRSETLSVKIIKFGEPLKENQDKEIADSE